jgi:two-component system sensor histidine kinase CreC
VDGQLRLERIHGMMERARQRRFEARIYGLVKTEVDMNAYVVGPDGRVAYDSAHPEHVGLDYRGVWRDVGLTFQGKYGARSTRVDRKDPRTSVLYVAAPIYHGDVLIGSLTVYKPVLNANLFISMATRKMVQAALLAAFLALLSGLAFSFWLVRPLENLTAYARQVRDGRKVSLPPLGLTREVRELGQAFEEMRDALEGKNYIENYVQALTHEIKSPVSSIRGAADLLQEDMPEERRRKFLDNITAESDRIAQIVEKLLTLSGLEARKALEQAVEIDAAGLAREVTVRSEAAAAAKGVRIECQAGSSCRVWGEPALVREALENLIANALAFSPRGGMIRISVAHEGATVRLAVEDEGPGIPEYALNRIFERFYSLPRPDTQLKSSGLGLSLVREIMLLHKGTVEVANRPEGGVRAELRFPVLPA